jgi:hypothetical protein
MFRTEHDFLLPPRRGHDLSVCQIRLSVFCRSV